VAAGRSRAGRRAGQRVRAYIPLDDPGRVALLLNYLRVTGARRQAAALLARDPAARAFLLARLLGGMSQAGARRQTAALLRRDPPPM
jgi:hypothetical protein